MQVARSGSIMMIRLENGEDILKSIGEAVKDEPSTMLIISGLGMLHEFELGYFDRGTYITKRFAEPHELLALQGSVASRGEPRLHIHATVADKDHNAFGGHLMKGRAWMSNEIGLVRLEGHSSERLLDETLRVGVLQI